MSFSAHKRDALDTSMPFSHRMSHLRSCAMLVGQKYRVPRRRVIERVRQVTGIDITNPATEAELLRAMVALVQIKESGMHNTAESAAG